MCVVGYWTIEDNVRPEYLGKIYRIMSVAVSLGTAAGPLLTGVLFDFGGYWSIWLSVLVVILVDVILRSLMLDRVKESDAKNGSLNVYRWLKSIEANSIGYIRRGNRSQR